MTRPFKVKMTDNELEALAALLSHDTDLLVIDDKQDEPSTGLIEEVDYQHLSAFYNRAQAVAHVTKGERA